MKASSDHILTSHAGSLPRPDAADRGMGGKATNHALAQKLRRP